MFSWSLFGVMPFANFCQEIKSKNTKQALDRNPQGHPKTGGQKIHGEKERSSESRKIVKTWPHENTLRIFLSQNFKLE